MSKRCPDCGFLNEDSRIYCGSCGELLDPELRLIRDLEKQKSVPSKNQPGKAEAASEPLSSRKDDGNEEYVHHRMAQERKSSPAPWIILGLIAAAIVISLVVLS